MPRLKHKLTRSAEEQRTRFSNLSTLDDLSELVEMTSRDLVWIVYRSGQRDQYTEFEVGRRGGKTPRVIHAPPQSLKILQQKIAEVFSNVYRRRPSVFGFVRGQSIRKNAIEHVGKRLVLNLDLKDFFPTINFGRVFGLLQAVPYSLPRSVATVLSQIACRDGRLPQGAPTSPIISNMICRRLDAELQRLAVANGAWYTRYADDITFSTWKPRLGAGLVATHPTEDQQLTLGDGIKNAIRSNGFAINESKVRLASRARRQSVTGITVNEFPNVNRRFVRHIRAVLYDWEKRGEDDANASYKGGRCRNPTAARPRMRDSIRGKLAFVRMVKGVSDPAFIRLWNRFASLAGAEPLPLPREDQSPEEWSWWAALTARAEAAIAFLEVKLLSRETVHCTAFRISPGRFLTAAHNKPDGASLTLWPGDDPVAVADTEFAKHPNEKIDLALISVNEPSGRCVSLPLAADELEKAEPVMALGFPAIAWRHPELHVKPGFFAGVFEGASEDYHRDVKYLTLDIKNSGGMSGCPILNRNGEVVGVMVGRAHEKVAASVPGQDFPQAIPSMYARALLSN